jgi:transcriptional regulator with XRE-family HTH domain
VAQIGLMLGSERRRVGLTQIELAHRTNMTQSSLARFEREDSTPNAKTVMRYAAALGQSVDVVFSHPEGATGPVTLDLDTAMSQIGNLRKSLGLTQSEVATRMGTTQPMVARLERGDSPPNLTTLERYARALGLATGLSLRPLRGK